MRGFLAVDLCTWTNHGKAPENRAKTRAGAARDINLRFEMNTQQPKTNVVEKLALKHYWAMTVICSQRSVVVFE
jgi:hypothetical protein